MSKPTVTITEIDHLAVKTMEPGPAITAYAAATRVLDCERAAAMRQQLTAVMLHIIKQYVDIVEPAAPKDYTVTAPARIRFQVLATNHEEATQHAHDVLDKNDYRDLLGAEGVEIDFGDEFLELEIDPNVRIEIKEHA